METSAIIIKLNLVSERVHHSYLDYSETQLNFKPNSESWSIAQVLDHLIKINESYYPILDALHQGTYTLPWHASVNFVVNYLGNFILQSVSPKREKKIKTFPIWEPDYSNHSHKILDQFLQHQQELIQRIQNSKNLIDKGAVICSPANRVIVYKLDKAFEIIATHEERHLLQMDKIASVLKQTESSEKKGS